MFRPTLFPLISDGRIATVFTPAIQRYARSRAAENRFLSRTDIPAGFIEEMMEDTTEYGMMEAMIRIATFSEMVKPKLKKVARKAEAMPLLLGGTEPMTELMSGEEKRPVPAPISPM